jgi:hypothetical protein
MAASASPILREISASEADSVGRYEYQRMIIILPRMADF